MNLEDEINRFTRSMQPNQMPHQQYNPHNDHQDQRLRSQRETATSQADLEFRDKINNRVNDHFFSQPEHGREARHYYDSSLISQNPQYNNTHNSDDNLYRRDNREGMNVKLDSLMFQSFHQPSVPTDIRVSNPQENPMSRTQRMQPAFDHTRFGRSSHDLGRENRPSYTEASLNPQMVPHYPSQIEPDHSSATPRRNQDPNSFLAPLPSAFNNVFHQTNRVSNRDRQNQRMQEFSSLPRTLNQPTNFVNDRPPAMPYKLSYESTYYQTGNQTGNSNQSGNQPQHAYLGNVGRSTGGYMPGTYQNSRVNYKDTHNERLQSLMPLARASATPVCTLDYATSINQNNQIRDESRTFREQDIQDRQFVADQRKAEWERMSSNITQLGGTPDLVVNTLRPVDTRQAE